MSRIPSNEYKKIIEEITLKVEQLKDEFNVFVSGMDFPNKDIDSEVEVQKAIKIFQSIKESSFGIFNICYHANGFIIKNENDTHVKGRAVEKFLGGRCDGKPIPDLKSAEIKLIQTIKSCDFLEQVMTIGTIAPDNTIAEKFEESCIYKKLKSMLIVTYLQEGKQLGDRINSVFHFKVDEPVWFNRFKEDYEYYASEWKTAREEYLAGIRKKKASGIMKSDTNGKRCPNHTLGIRSDGIILPRHSFKEISNYYVK